MLRKDELLNEKEQLFNEAQELLRAETIDEKAINDKQMRMAEINGMIKALDDNEAVVEERSTMGPQVAIEKSEDTKKEEYRDAFYAVLRKNATPEQRSMVEGTDTAGGYLVPEETTNTIVEKKGQSNIMRELCSKMTLVGEKKVPIQGNIPASQFIAEGGTYPTADASFGIKSFEALKNGIIIPVSEELVADNSFNLDGYLAKKVAESFDDGEEANFVNGTGTNAPRGILLDAETGVTAASTSALTAQEILDLVFSIKAKYRKNAVMSMANSTLGVIRGLWRQDTQTFTMEYRDGHYFIEGIKVYVSDEMPAIGAGNAVIAYGDFSYYQIADRSGLTLQVLRDGANYGEKGLVGFKFTARGDAKLLIPEAIKTLKMKAA